MTFLFLMALLYFLPSLIGRNKRQAGAIFLVNFLAGWTIIGWFATLIWACVPEDRHVLVYAGQGVNYCTRCGTPQFTNARFCGGCGRVL
jgi:Superinfection immunity protein